MKFVFLLSLGIFLTAPVQAKNSCEISIPASWKKYLRTLPKDARIHYSKVLRCVSFGGDELSKDKAACYKKIGCDSYESETKKMQEKYENNSLVTRAYHCVYSTSSAHDCPPEDPLGLSSH